MIAIVDSGSTKTLWRFIGREGKAQDVVTGGLNPYAVSAGEIKDCLEKDLYPFIDNAKVKYVFFYGSGCADPAKRTVLQVEMEDFFRYAEINIESDLTGAALALCGKEKGLVGILGTGAATCYYDGEKIDRRVASLGYILGDEGSGARIGAHFLADYLREGMPAELRGEFAPLCPYPLHEIIDLVYHGREVGRMLGEMALFASERMEHPYVQEVLRTEFTAFFEKQILPYNEILKDLNLGLPNLSLNLLGSTAYHARTLIEETAAKSGVQIGKILQSPMDGLDTYFRPQLKVLLQQDETGMPDLDLRD